MGMYISGINPPKNCGRCPYNYSSIKCKITKTEIDRDDEYKEKLPDCPIAEVKEPHGKLIDVNMIEYENWYLEETGESYKMIGKDDIDRMSTIIEATKKE